MVRDPDFERRVSASARQFDVVALLDLLEARGYEHLRFRSERTRSFRSSRIASIDFDEPSADWVTITVNLGLLSSQSPLPDYFEKMLDYGVVDGRFAAFIAALDHPLLAQRFEAKRGRRSAWLLPGWPETEQSLLGVMDVRSPATMDAVMRRAFPELGVIVERAGQDGAISVPGVITNRGRFGYSAFGGVAMADVAGLSVTLVSEDALTDRGERWEEAATRRLRQWVLPVLEGTGIGLQVTLEIDEPPHAIDLTGDSHLGYDAFEAVDGTAVRFSVLLSDWLPHATLEEERDRA